MQFVKSPTFNIVTHFCPWCMQTLPLTPRETLCLSQLMKIYQYCGLAGDGRFYCMLSTSAYSHLEHAQAGDTINSQGQAGPSQYRHESTKFHTSKQGSVPFHLHSGMRDRSQSCCLHNMKEPLLCRETHQSLKLLSS